MDVFLGLMHFLNCQEDWGEKNGQCQLYYLFSRVDSIQAFWISTNFYPNRLLSIVLRYFSFTLSWWNVLPHPKIRWCLVLTCHLSVETVSVCLETPKRSVLTCLFTVVHCFNFRTTPVMIHQGHRTLVSGRPRSCIGLFSIPFTSMEKFRWTRIPGVLF